MGKNKDWEGRTGTTKNVWREKDWSGRAAEKATVEKASGNRSGKKEEGPRRGCWSRRGLVCLVVVPLVEAPWAREGRGGKDKKRNERKPRYSNGHLSRFRAWHQ